MSKNNSEESLPKSAFEGTLSSETLLKMLIDTQKQLAESQKEMASAILESRKPWVDPKVLEQKQRDLEDRRKQIAVQQAVKVATKRSCPHTRENGTPNIKWMQHSNNIIKGVCGTCFSEFDVQTSAADKDLFRRDLKSMRNMGRAGEHAKRTEIAYA